jgi:hypothetical protein
MHHFAGTSIDARGRARLQVYPRKSAQFPRNPRAKWLCGPTRA